MRVIITGGTGLVGKALTVSLVKDGHEVVVLTRNYDQSNGLPGGTRLIEWDARTANGWGELADGAGAIVNLAGESIAGNGFLPQRWTPARRKRILESRVNAGNAVVEAVKSATTKPGVVIQSSAVGYYGSHDFAETLTEDHAPANDFLANVCKQWEASTAEVESMGVRRAVIRSGLILSSRDGVLPLMALPFKLFVGGKIGGGKQPLSWIHIDDHIRGIRYLIDTPTASGDFNLTAPEPITNEGFSKALGEALGRPSYFPTPGFPFKLIFGELGQVLLLEGQSVVPEYLQKSGFKFGYPDAFVALRDLYRRGI